MIVDDKRNPLVSVIVPSYNHADFLEQRLQTILQQTYQNFELIILDDCSVDNSMDIIQRYSNDPHVAHIVRNEHNSGSPFKQWYKGITLAKGNIIWIAECDDSCSLDMLERLLQLYLQHDCSFAFSCSMMIDEHDKPLNISQRHFRRDGYWRGEDFVRKYLCLSNAVWNASSVIFSKQNALSISKEFMDYCESGDWIFWIDMALKGNVAVVSEPLNLFRVYAESNTAKTTKSGKLDMEDKRVYDRLKANGLMSWTKSFIKQKRMAKRILKGYALYANEEIRQVVKETWNIPLFYYVLAQLSMKYHQLFK